MVSVGIGEAANLLAYAFAPAALVTPLGALSVLVAAVLSSRFLRERLNFIGKVIFIKYLILTSMILYWDKVTHINSGHDLSLPNFILF